MERTSNMAKQMPIREFIDFGYLQEVNRRFFHPLGLSLAVRKVMQEDEDPTVFGVLDYRGDLEGLQFDPAVLDTDDAREKASNVNREMNDRLEARIKAVPTVIQTIPNLPTITSISAFDEDGKQHFHWT